MNRNRKCKSKFVLCSQHDPAVTHIDQHKSLMIYLYQKEYNSVMTRLIKVKGLSKPVVQVLALDSNNTE